MSTVADPKRDRRKKLKFKLSLGSTSSGPSNLPSNMKANLPDILEALKMQRIADEDKRRTPVAGNSADIAASKDCSKGEVLPNPVTTASGKCKGQASSERKACDARTFETSLIKEEEVLDDGKPESKVLTESDVVSIARRLREVLQANGPSQEDDLLEALSPSQAHLILQAYGTLTTFLSRRPGFRVLHEDLYSFIYYEDPDEEDNESSCVSVVQCGATTEPSLASGSDSGLQYAVARDGGARRLLGTSSSSGSYESAVDGEDDEQEKNQMKHGWNQVGSLPRCQSPTLQAVQQKRDAEAPTQGWNPDRLAELESTLRNGDAKIAELKEKLKTFRETQAREVRQLHAKLDELSKRSPPAPPAPTHNAAKEKNSHTAMGEQKPTSTPRVSAQASPRPLQPLPRPPRRHRSPPPLRPKTKEKPRLFPIIPRPRPVPQVGKKTKRSAKWPPVPRFHELPGDKKPMATPCSDVESRHPSRGESPGKSKVDIQVSKIVQMVQKKHPSYTEPEIRKWVDHLRRSQGGFSRMTFNAIVELVLGHLKEKH